MAKRKAPELVTSAEAAAIAGLSPVSFRSAMYYARKLGVDCRVETLEGTRWDADRLRAYLDARPGRGRWKSGAAEVLGTERAKPRSTVYRGPGASSRRAEE